jgi:hypothetical protein
MHLSDNKQTIIGDYVGTPEWLAKVLPTAYPSRSVDAELGVETVTGKQYEMVITDVSLLGVRWPGCTTLEDLPLYYGAEIPEGVEIQADMDVSLIRSKFYQEGPGADNWFTWIRGERFDNEGGLQLIVDEGDGTIIRVPVEVDGDEVAFGDPVEVLERYEDKEMAASAIIAGMKMADPAMIIYASRAETGPVKTTQEGEAMDDELRLSLAKRLGLPEDATEEQVRAELAKPVGETPGGGEGEGEGEGEGDGEGEGEGEGKPKSETVTLDRATFDELKKGATLAASHEDERIATRVNETVEAAIADGRIPPARREHWKKALEADFDGNSAVIDGLEKGLVPVSARGNMGGGDGEGAGDGVQGSGLPDDWFPEVATIRAQTAKDQRVVNAREG